MAKKYSGGIRIIAGFKLDDPQPIDDRLVVTSSNSLTDPNFTNIYPGIIVSVSESNGSAYKWNGEDRTNIDNWEKILVSSDTSSFAQTSNVISNTTFNAFSSSYSQSVVDFTTTSESMASEIADFQSFSSSFSQSVVNFNTFSSSIAESVSTKAITASSGIFFSSSGVGPKNYSIDYAKVYSASSNVLVPSSGSLTITASGIKIEGDLDATGSVSLGGSLSFSGFSFTDTIENINTGDTQFGSGSVPSTTNHQFTGSVNITGSNLTFNGSNVVTSDTISSIATTTIATDISGAIDTATGSLLDAYTFISSSEQIATDVSGAIDAATSSLLDAYTFLSSSEQIATDVSGAIDAATSSLLDAYTFISSSEQIATDVSGAIDAATSSLLDAYTFISSSEQIATDVSGAIDAATSSLLDAYTFISSSEQIATDVSGAVDAATSSLLDSYTFLSSSEQIASDISGAIDAATSSLSGFPYSGSDFIGIANTPDQAVITGSLFVFGSSTQDSASGHITASGDISASGKLFFSSSETTATNYKVLVQNLADGRVYTTGSVGGTGNQLATQIELGDATTGNNNFTSTTTVQDAIDDIDTILGLLAPAKPPNLSDISLNFVNTNFSGRGTSGILTSSITSDGTQFFTSSQAFFNGDIGTLTAFSSSDGGVTFGIAGTRDLTTASDTGSYVSMSIETDEDPYKGQAGTAGFYKQLGASVTTSFSPSATKRVVKLSHSTTGDTPNFEFYVANNNYTGLGNEDKSFHYNESVNGFHYQSGIKYLGKDDTISSSFTVTINSDAVFLNSSGRLASTKVASSYTNEQFKTDTNGFTPGESHPVTQSLTIADSKYKNGNLNLKFYVYRASSTVGALDTNLSIPFLIDSTNEDEIEPISGVTRVKSGRFQYPDFGTGTNDFSDTFNSATELTTGGEFELQFANQYYHWPASTNYSARTPSGPDYSSISGDSNNGLRYATFELGDIDRAPSLTVNIVGALGFDNALVQTTNNFEFHLMVVNGGTPVTNWMNLNAVYDTSFGDPTDRNGIACLTGGTEASSGTLVRNVTFSAGGVQTGTVYVRIGWSVGAGTDPTSPSTRMFKYITKS